MLRAVIGVILGYATMFVLVFVTFTAAYLGMGADRAFESNSYQVSGLWIVLSFVLGTAAAIAGGYVCAMFSRLWKPPLVLAGLVVVLGLLMAVPVLTAEKEEPKARTAEVSNLEAMENARTPAWIAVLNPLVSAIGVVIGGRLRGAPAN